MKNIFKFSFLIIILSVVLWSCKKDSIDQATSEDVRVADLAVSDVFTYASTETDNKKVSDTTEGMVVSVMYDSVALVWITTITFDNFTPADGVTRNGSIIINWELGWFWDSTKSVTVTFDQFSRDSVILGGELKLQHTTTFDDGVIERPGHKVTETNMSLTFPDKATLNWSGWRTIEWKSGWLTILDPTDNVFEINWHKEGINRLGESFSGDGENLILDSGCDIQGFTSGIITILKGDGNQFSIDFGDGECDGTYTISGGNRTLEVTQ